MSTLLKKIGINKIIISPSFLRGSARMMDLFGYLDSYKKIKNEDFVATKKDWEKVGKYLQDAMTEYESGKRQ